MLASPFVNRPCFTVRSLRGIKLAQDELILGGFVDSLSVE